MLVFYRITRGLTLGCLLLLAVACHGQRLSAGYHYSFGICADSSAMAWGQNAESQLGTSAFIRAEVPISVNLDQLIAIDGGAAHTLALRADSTVWVWGGNARGQLGMGDLMGRNAPAQISPTDLSGIVAISAGREHSMALGADGRVWAWGANDDSQLGDSTIMDRWTPHPVSGLSGIVAISAGYNFSLALGADGRVWAWGANDEGQIGDGNAPLVCREPFLLAGIDSVVAISAGGWHVLALRSNGEVWAWGYNDRGQLGLGTHNDQLTPDRVLGISGVTALAAGGKHSLILRQDGTVWVTGGNDSGQLGLGDYQSHSSFMPIDSGFNAIAIACGENHSLAILASGSCVGWGSNFDGAVGNGTQVDQATPTPILGLCPTDFAILDSVFTDYFRPMASAPDRWIAGELSSSIRLADERMVWIFGKSYLDTLLPNNGIPCAGNRSEITNCLLVQDTLNPNAFTTCLNTVPGRPSRAYFQTDTSYFVPGHGYQHDADSVSIFLAEYKDDTTFLGTCVARVGVVTMTVLDITRIIPLDTTIYFGTAVIVDSNADQLYVYGSRKGSGGFFPYVMRRILSNKNAAWEFATPTGWSSQIADASRISPFPVSQRYSVTSLQGHHYLITQTPEQGTTQCGRQRNIFAYRSDDLKGPFEEGRLLATSPGSAAGFPAFAFNAYAHPDQDAFGFTRCDSLLVSYNMRAMDSVASGCFTPCISQGSQNADTWRPHFLRVPFSLVDTGLSTTTVASFTSSSLDGMAWTFNNTSQFATAHHWDFGDGNVSSEVNPRHVFSNTGPHIVTLTVSGCETPHTFKDTLGQQDSIPVVAPQFRVFPQPSGGTVHVQGENLERGPVQLELYSLLGEMIAQEVHTSTNGHFDEVLQYSLSAGMYVLRIVMPQSSAHFRIVVQ